MKERIQKLPVKWKLAGFGAGICLLLAGGLIFAQQQMQKKLYDQQMAQRWSKEEEASQISVFYAEGEVEDEKYFLSLEQTVETALSEASVVREKETARLWIDAVSCAGTVTISSERTTVELKAFGVSGEFFQFHPKQLISGSLFHGDSMMQDGIVIDTETAWQLFGSSDVAGMQVMIADVPHYITGVIERPSGKLDQAAGLEKPICYLSLESLKKYGMLQGGYTYELVMPDPIRNFAYSTLQTAVGAENDHAVVIENSSRYTFLSLLKVMQDFGLRSMSLKDIVYPYWENRARGYEDILALLLLGSLLLFAVPCMFGIVTFCVLWKRKSWNTKMLVQWMQDRLYAAKVQRAKAKREKKKE